MAYARLALLGLALAAAAVAAALFELAPPVVEEALTTDDECDAEAAGDGANGRRCALTALQLRKLRTREVATEALRLKGKGSGLAVAFNGSNMSYDLLAKGPPPTALAYDGMAWPTMVVTGPGPTHIFAIGDWGGMTGDWQPEEGRPRVVEYQGGAEPGPHVFPRTRWNYAHTSLLCSHKQFVECFNSNGQQCDAGCGFVVGVDTAPQQLVAKAFNERQALKQPKFIINVGDNFYWGGIEKNCGTPMTELSFAAQHQFDSIWEKMYTGNAPWLSILGNHDYGGRRFDNGWDQQIAYTWKSARWVMPASYWMQTVNYVDQGFTVDLFLLDSNKEDAKDLEDDPEHNICGAAHNNPGATCASAGGPESVQTCKEWFHKRWDTQQQWLMTKLAQSQADWQIVVTHFPCDGEDSAWYVQLYQTHGLDLLVTGHQHNQILYPKDYFGGLTCFVTGGGGGITSEATPVTKTADWYGEAQYGFYDMTITKDSILLESINYDGSVAKSATVLPKARTVGAPPTASATAPAAPNASTVKAAGASPPANSTTVKAAGASPPSTSTVKASGASPPSTSTVKMAGQPSSTAKSAAAAPPSTSTVKAAGAAPPGTTARPSKRN